MIPTGDSVSPFSNERPQSRSARLGRARRHFPGSSKAVRRSHFSPQRGQRGCGPRLVPQRYGCSHSSDLCQGPASARGLCFSAPFQVRPAPLWGAFPALEPSEHVGPAHARPADVEDLELPLGDRPSELTSAEASSAMCLTDRDVLVPRRVIHARFPRLERTQTIRDSPTDPGISTAPSALDEGGIDIPGRSLSRRGLVMNPPAGIPRRRAAPSLLLRSPGRPSVQRLARTRGKATSECPRRGCSRQSCRPRSTRTLLGE